MLDWLMAHWIHMPHWVSFLLSFGLATGLLVWACIDDYRQSR